MPDVTTELLQRFESKRAARPEPHGEELSPQRRSYRKAAAVLHCFKPETLRPLDPERVHKHPRLLLFEDMTHAAGQRARGLFTLKPEVRRQALCELSSREAMAAALEANPDRTLTPLQRMWEAYLGSGSVPPPETLGYLQLSNLCQILSWLDGLHEGLPSVASVMDLARRRSILASFEHLVDANFTGREKELDLLRDHVTVRLPAGILESLLSWPKALLESASRPILALYGPGGIGKSALIGRLLTEYALSDTDTRVPFAYLPFDQPTLRIENPFTILVEAAAQFELQLPEHKAAIERFHDAVREYRDTRGALRSRREVTSSREARITEVHHADRLLYQRFADLLSSIGAREIGGKTVPGPVLLAFDTFEEVQYRDRESLGALWRMLATLKDEYPLLRVVISGRASVVELGLDSGGALREEKLEELAPSDRVLLLQRLGVSDAAVARSVAEQIGGNPLSLRLAARVVTANPEAATPKGITGLATRKWLFFQIDKEVIQGQLYRRILDHIHDDNVRKLAHPGMVLRRVDPEVILEVLAPLCHIAVETIGQAEHLFEELRREHAFIQPGDEGTLEYRPEIRQAMIRLLQQDKFSEVRALHRAAIQFYERKAGVGARSEELYHRLALGEDETWILDQRWISGIESSIASNLEEYPIRMQAWLASRMSLEVPRSVYAGADLAAWERNITRKVQHALSELQTGPALQLLRERSDRSDASPLFALEAKAHLLQGDLESAWGILEKGVERVSQSTNRGRLAEVFWLQSQVALLRKEPGLADRLLGLAEDAVAGSSSPIPLTHVLAHRLLLREQFPEAQLGERSPEVRWRLDKALGRVDENAAYASSFVLPLALAMLRSEYPATAARLALLSEPDFSPSSNLLTSENLQGLEEYREAWETEATFPSEEAAA